MFIIYQQLIALPIQNLDNRAPDHRSQYRPVFEIDLYCFIRIRRERANIIHVLLIDNLVTLTLRGHDISILHITEHARALHGFFVDVVGLLENVEGVLQNQLWVVGLGLLLVISTHALGCWHDLTCVDVLNVEWDGVTCEVAENIVGV